MYDRNLNEELSKGDLKKKSEDIKLEMSQSKVIIDKVNQMIGTNGMVYKTGGNIKSLTFVELPDILYLTQDSQPFIGDLNGDQIDDILFNNQNSVTKGKLNVALFNKDSEKYDIGNFKDKLVDSNCGGETSLVENPSLTTPHTVSMLDFDGDCLSDLFFTVQNDADPSKKYYEIYLRRDSSSDDAPNAMNGLNSFCLIQVDDISLIQNNQVFDFADIDRDGMIDILFITDKKSMNFIVNYNMLKNPSQISLNPFKDH